MLLSAAEVCCTTWEPPVRTCMQPWPIADICTQSSLPTLNPKYIVTCLFFVHPLIFFVPVQPVVPKVQLWALSGHRLST